MLLSDCIENYLRHIRLERGYTQKTVKGYPAWLHTLHTWMVANGYPIPPHRLPPTYAETLLLSSCRKGVAASYPLVGRPSPAWPGVLSRQSERVRGEPRSGAGVAEERCRRPSHRQ